MKNSKNRGFTIVELVIVIAVIAILAGVLIPTFVSVIKKANTSADVQATRQMNTQLAMLDATDKPENINDAIRALSDAKIDLDNYKPLTSGMQYYWVKDINRVVYANDAYEVVYPDEYKTLTKTAGNWYSLNGEIKLESYTIAESKEVAVSSAGQLVSFINNYNKGVSETKSVTKITLSNDIDLMGASYKFIGNETNGYTSDLEIDGNGKKIYGFRDDSNTIFGPGEFSKKGYGYGLFYKIGSGATVTIKNVTFSGMVADDTKNSDTGTAGLIAGYVYGNLVLENVTIENGYIHGSQKIGAIAGRVDGSLSLKNVTLKNVEVVGELEVAKLVGYVIGSVTVDNVNATENVTVKNPDGFDCSSIYNSELFSSQKIAAVTGKANVENTLFYIEKAVDTSTGKLYSGRHYIWSGITQDYFWQIIASSERQITIDNKPCYYYGWATSGNIVK